MSELLIGCGHDWARKVAVNDAAEWRNLTTLDMNPAAKPHVLHDLCNLPLPFAADSFDEIHAYDVLEHTRHQGDWRGFFAEFEEFWRILKPGGLFVALVPRHNGPWAWGDPGHCRVIQLETLSFLDQQAFIDECRPGGTNKTDYRPWYRADFQVVASQYVSDVQLAFVLRAVKPSRWVAP